MPFAAAAAVTVLNVIPQTLIELADFGIQPNPQFFHVGGQPVLKARGPLDNGRPDWEITTNPPTFGAPNISFSNKDVCFSSAAAASAHLQGCPLPKCRLRQKQSNPLPRAFE